MLGILIQIKELSFASFFAPVPAKALHIPSSQRCFPLELRQSCNLKAKLQRRSPACYSPQNSFKPSSKFSPKLYLTGLWSIHLYLISTTNRYNHDGHYFKDLKEEILLFIFQFSQILQIPVQGQVVKISDGEYYRPGIWIKGPLHYSCTSRSFITHLNLHTAVLLSIQPKQTLETLIPQIAWENKLNWLSWVCI